jgi:predicted Ser/Thr protein kinase
MGEPTKCPDCGSEVPADAPGGACPRCALGAALPSSPPVPTADEVAAKLPGYDVLGVLGRGGMGVVFKARQKALDRIVALKVLPPAMAAAPGFSERFVREAKAMARLAHPNIVAVHEFGESGGLFYLVLEYVDGVNVREAMRTGAITPKDAIAIVPQICDALQYAHDRGVVHRDIKPENVLITREGRVKIADFGLAKLADREFGDVSLTGASQVMGTLHYMAPEQWERPKEVDHRADIYSLGVVFYEMLTGELPVGRFEPPSKKAQLDVRVDEVVMRSIERDRERRWQRADEMKTQVSALSSPTGAPPAAAAPAPVSAESAVAATSTGVASLVFLTLAVVATTAALVSGIDWVWWLVPGAAFASIACAIVWAAKRPKTSKPVEPEAEELPEAAYLPPRVAPLVTLAWIAVAVAFFSPVLGTGGMAFGGAGLVAGLALWWVQDDRHDAVLAAQKGKAPPPGAPVAVVVVASIALAMGLACIGWWGYRLLLQAQRGIDEPAAAGAAPWEFETSTPGGGDAKHRPTEADRQAIWRTWSRAQAVQGAWSDDVGAVYAAEDARVLARMSADLRVQQGASGSLGPPLLPLEKTALAKFRVVRARFGGWNEAGRAFTSASVDAADGDTTLRFAMRRDETSGPQDPRWLFVAAPVEFE